MNYINCEKAGVPAKKIKEYLEYLEKNQLSTHNIIMAKGDDIFFEKYYEPFNKDFLHRMYSVSKSFVSLAVEFAIQDGLFGLDDKIVDYFPKESENVTDENVKNQTIRHMLMMSTAKTPENWFLARCSDRVRLYFENKCTNSRPSGTIYEYDSTGSFVLGALVEKLTGKLFMDYLREKLFDKIGVSKEAYCLKCPGGYSWGDSAVLCKATDLLKVARFVLNGGKWNGEQLLNEDYIKNAVSSQIDNDYMGIRKLDAQGYGYLFWRTRENSYFMNGMGCQFAVCVPQKDLILVHNGDNDGKLHAKSAVIDGFFDIIVNSMSDCEIEENEKDQKELKAYADSLILQATTESPVSPMEEKINNVEYVLSENPMGIKRVCFVFEGDEGRMEYTNAQGDKTIYMGRCKNVFAKFPQEGYSDEVGSVYAPGNYYDCCASFGWSSEQKLFIKVQIVDKYFGNLNISVGFRDEYIGIDMRKTAEDFLEEYQGFAGGKAVK